MKFGFQKIEQDKGWLLKKDQWKGKVWVWESWVGWNTMKKRGILQLAW
jgi:hypothetical protein